MIRTVVVAVALTCPLLAHAVERPAPLPDPLPRPDWAPPEARSATLSNGLQVLLVPDHEAPLFDVRLVVGVGDHVDPLGKEGLLAATFGQLDAGAGELSADELSTRLRRLGATLSGSLTGADAGMLRATGITRNLEPTLDLWALAITAPTFPADELDTWRAREQSELARVDRDPSRIAGRVYWKLVYGDTYAGRTKTAASLDAITADDLKATHARWIGPDNAVVLVGGDVTLEQVVPLLEERLGDWSPAGVEPVEVDPAPRPVEAPTLYFVDHPGAAQTQIRTGTAIGTRTDPAYVPLLVGNHGFGGAFTSRVNLNLREDKGYTYGARCWLSMAMGPGVLGCSTSVQTEVTGPALAELRSEMEALHGARPLTEGEVARSREALARQWPMDLETVEGVLDELADMWRYDLPDDWITGRIPALEEVTPEAADEALRDAIDLPRTFWLVVGDGEAIRGDLEAFGLPIVVLDGYGDPTSN